MYTLYRNIFGLWSVYKLYRNIFGLWSVYTIYRNIFGLWSVYTIYRNIFGLWSVYTLYRVHVPSIQQPIVYGSTVDTLINRYNNRIENRGEGGIG